MFYLFLKRIGWILLHLLFQVQIEGKEFIPKKGPLIIAMNHISPMDPVVLGILFPRKIHFFAAKELFDIPIIGWVVRHLGIIPVDRKKRDFYSLKKAISYLLSGEIVAIFPQGGIPHPDSPERYVMKPGVAYLRLKTCAPILCVCISGTNKAIPRGTSFLKKIFIKIFVSYRCILDNKMGKNEILYHVRKEIFACEDLGSRG